MTIMKFLVSLRSDERESSHNQALKSPLEKPPVTTSRGHAETLRIPIAMPYTRACLEFIMHYPCPQHLHSGNIAAQRIMTAPSNPWEMSESSRRRRVRSHLILAALWAPTSGEKDACLDALVDQQESDDHGATHWPRKPLDQTCTADPWEWTS